MSRSKRSMTVILIAVFCVLSLQSVSLLSRAHALESYKEIYRQGMEYKEKGQCEEAIEAFAKAISDNETEQLNIRFYGMRYDNYLPHRGKGICHYQLRQYEKAVQELEISYNQTKTKEAKRYLDLARTDLTNATNLAMDKTKSADLLKGQQIAIVITQPEVTRGVSITSSDQSIPIKGRVISTTGISGIFINGKAISSYDEKGYFSAEAPLKIGNNSVEVAALDYYKNKVTEQFTVTGEKKRPTASQKVLSAGNGAREDKLATELVEGRSYALVIGINQYPHLDHLLTATNDARDIANVLKEDYGFESKLILDQQASRDNILEELNKLRKRLKTDDRLLIYYAGHGYYNQETDTAYWLPVDAEKDSTTKWIEAKSISDQLKLISSRQILVIADSCYSGTLSRLAQVELTSSDTRDNYLRKLRDKTARVLIASGGNEPVSDSGGKGHSIFADSLLGALKNPGRRIFTAEELHTNRIKESVAGRAEQTPEYRVIRNSGHEGGDFIFVRIK